MPRAPSRGCCRRIQLSEFHGSVRHAAMGEFRLELRQLRYFIQIVEAKSFGKAATVLRLAQPALSHQIRKLEDELGVQLLIRHSGGVLPTEAGETFLEHAKGVLRQIEQARQETTDRSLVVSGKVAVGMAGPVCLAFGARIVREFLQSFPNVSFNLVEGRSTQLEEWLLSGNLDLAVLYEPSLTKQLLHEEIATEEVVLLGPANDAALPARLKRIEDLAKFPIILPTHPNTIRTLIDRVASEHGVAIASVIELNSYTTMMRLVAEGMGYSLLPELCVREEASQGRFRICRLPQPLMSHRLVLSSPTDRPLTKAVREIARRLPALLASRYRADGLAPRGRAKSA
jgi:LysR family nitrogen assimilation transcriptional regulator